MKINYLRLLIILMKLGKELSRQLGIYRCQFVTLQKEIEELRHTNPSTAKEDIKIRVEKEKALSQVM